jgi:aminoglycoside phosphotransferase (APT) family kinase protein
MGEHEAVPGLDLLALKHWFSENVAPVERLTAQLIGRGLSNLTYEVGDGEHRWVLRRPPLSHVLPTAHDMRREYTVQKALSSSDVPVPEMISFCDDERIIGCPFYVMEFVDGEVPADSQTFETHFDEAARATLSKRLIEVLVALHSIDYSAIGLDDFGRPQGYMSRQVSRFVEQLRRSKTRELPVLDELADRLAKAVPQSSDSSIVHGDYRLDNTILGSSGDIAAVLDWELSTLGDPLADLGMLSMYWADPGDDLFADAPGVESSLITALPGFMRKNEALDLYASLSGRDVENIAFYQTFAHFKLAVILEGINKRFQDGGTVGEGFEKVADMVVKVANRGKEIADDSGVL